MFIDLKCQLFCAVAANIVHKVSLEQIGDFLLLLLRNFSQIREQLNKRLVVNLQKFLA